MQSAALLVADAVFMLRSCCSVVQDDMPTVFNEALIKWVDGLAA